MLTRNFVWLGVLLMAGYGVAAAQSKGGGQNPPGGGNTGGGNTGGGNTGSTPGTRTPGTTGTQGTMTPGQSPIEQQRGWFLSGKVVLDDGTKPLEPVTIVRVCGTARVPEAYTDSKGHFAFEVGHNQSMMRDASFGANDIDPLSNTSQTSMEPMMGGRNPLGGQRLMGCELTALLTGYRSDVIDLGNRRVMDNPDVGTIVLHRLGNVTGNTVSATSLEAPKPAKKAYEKGMHALRKGNWADAQQQLEKAVAAYPNYAAAWYLLGLAQMQQKNTAAAETSFAKSLEADSKFLKPYLPMAEIALQQRKWDQVADYSERLVKLDPVDFPQGFLYLAIANAARNNYDAAEQNAREALKLDTAHHFPYAEYVLGISLANKHDYPGALEMMKSYIGRVPNAPNAENIKKQIEQLEQANATAAPAAAAPSQKP